MNIGKIRLTKDACYCGIQDFYDLIARRLGYDPQKVMYDCTKINVSKSIQNRIFEFYKDENQSQGAISLAWVCYGPKASLKYDDHIAEVMPGFIREVTK